MRLASRGALPVDFMCHARVSRPDITRGGTAAVAHASATRSYEKIRRSMRSRSTVRIERSCGSCRRMPETSQRRARCARGGGVRAPASVRAHDAADAQARRLATCRSRFPCRRDQLWSAHHLYPHVQRFAYLATSSICSPTSVAGCGHHMRTPVLDALDMRWRRAPSSRDDTTRTQYTSHISVPCLQRDSLVTAHLLHNAQRNHLTHDQERAHPPASVLMPKRHIRVFDYISAITTASKSP